MSHSKRKSARTTANHKPKNHPATPLEPNGNPALSGLHRANPGIPVPKLKIRGARLQAGSFDLQVEVPAIHWPDWRVRLQDLYTTPNRRAACPNQAQKPPSPLLTSLVSWQWKNDIPRPNQYSPPSQQKLRETNPISRLWTTDTTT